MREKNKLLMIIIAFLSVVLIGSPGSMAYDWSIEVVDNSGTVGLYPSLCFDNSGNIYISYQDGGKADLKLAALVDSVWNIEVVDSVGYLGKYSTIKIDSLGNRNIAYYHEGIGALKYAGWIEPLFQWDFQVIDNASTSDYRPCMLINSDGYVEVSYYESTGHNLVRSIQDSSGWQTQVIDSIGNVGQFACFAIDSAGRPGWSYHDVINHSLKYAGWIEPLFNWAFETADNVSTSGYTIDMIFNLSGEIEMSYYDSDNGDLRHVAKAGAEWTAQVVDSVGDVGAYSSLAMDSSGNRNISYYDVDIHQLKYAGRLASKYEWIFEVVDDSGNVGPYPSITLDSLGLPAISYYDMGNGDLKFAVRDSMSWNCQVVDTTGDVGKYSSVTFDPNEPKWAISYFDDTDNDLKYAESTEVVVAIPTLSEWGMLILALLLLAAGTVGILRRKKAAVKIS